MQPTPFTAALWTSPYKMPNGRHILPSSCPRIFHHQRRRRTSSSSIAQARPLMARFWPSTSLPWLLISAMFLAADATTFTLVNECDYTIWPGVLANAGEPPLSTTGFSLQKGESRPLAAPTGWGGRFWARTRCAQDPATGKLSCLTGDCGSGQLECGGRGAAPPTTLAEFKLDGDSGLDFFDVSLVDGYNLPLLVAPQGGSGGRGNCTSVGCTGDLNGACPSELRVTAKGNGSALAACKSACDAFRQPQYCCSGAYGSPQACKPTPYSEVFKSACPQAYSYAYDDETSTFTCAGADYVITFCPSSSASQKSAPSQDQTPEAAATTYVPLINNTMVYEGVAEVSCALPSTHAHISAIGLVGVAVSVWRPWLLFSS
ncbi:hypothetical protein BT93_F0256 [Corymbia citriodora subsp. variegata]|nr:hypothetical protein BT93_F0256 [Corymbia citriodora subsp. variegata]